MKTKCTAVLALMLLCVLARGQVFADILRGEDRVTIPFTYTNNFILVEVRMFGMLPMSFIFDTGAEHIILFKREFADVFNVRYDLRIPIVGSDLSREVYALVARNVDIEVDGLNPMHRDILVLEEDYLTLEEIIGKPIHGILGGGFFKNIVLQIDYRRQRLTLYQPHKFRPPGRGFMEIPLDIRSGKPYMQTELVLTDQTSVEATLLIDTGAGLPLLLHANSHESLTIPENYIRGKLGLGLGGYVEGFISRIESLVIGEVDFPQIITSFQDLSDAVELDSTRFRNGLIGNQLLSRFHVYVDYIRETMYLQPTGRYRRKFSMDKSGLVIFAMGQNLNIFVVQDVIANSPAEEAGIQPGDVIRKLQGAPTEGQSLNDLLHMLQRREGKRIRMVVQRQRETLRKTFRLRELI